MDQRTGGFTGSRRRGRAAVVVIAGLVLLAGGLGTIYALTRDDAGGAQAVADGAGADRTAVRTQSFEITTVAVGELAARNQIEIRARIETRTTVVEIVNEGTKVKAGDLLIRLNTDKIDADMIEETARVETARAELVAAENELKIQESDNESKLRQALLQVELAGLARRQWVEGEVAAKRQQLETAVERGEREVTRLTDRVARSETLYENKFLSFDDLEKDRIALIEARAAREKAKTDLKVFEDYELPKETKKLQSDEDEAIAEVDRVKLNNSSNLASKSAVVANKRQQLTIRENKVAKLQEQKAASTVHAPSDGLVVYATSLNSGGWGRDNSGPLQIGREVNPNELLMVLPDTSEMIAAVRVHESLTARIRPGQKATIKVDAAGTRAFSGTVESIGVLAETGGWRDPNLREYTVRVALETSDDKSIAALKPSMRCEAEITLGQVGDALTLPVQAVFMDGPVRYVYTDSAGRFKRTPIRMGRQSSTLAEIRSGLTEGQIVLLREPTPSEVMGGTWVKDELLAAGYQVDDNGNPVVEAAMPSGRPSGRPGGPPTGAPPAAGQPAVQPAGQPAGERPRGGGRPPAAPAPTVTSDAGKPAAPSAPAAAVPAAAVPPAPATVAAPPATSKGQ
jgi:HlyD family secretion protein